jgi:mannose-1-phosphate guanylyltransferase
LPILDVPLGAFGLRVLTEDAPPVLVNASYLADEVVACLGPWGEAEFFIEQEAYGTAGTLREVSARIGERVLTWNADMITDLHPRTLMDAHLTGGAAATIAVAEVDAGADFEVIDNRVVRFIDRRIEPAASGVRFLGAAVFERETLSLIPPHGPAGLGETVLRALGDEGRLVAHHHPGYASDVGTPESYLQVSLDVLAGDVSPPESPPGTISGGTYRGPGASAPDVSLGPGAILLAGSIVEAGAWVERSIVMPGAVVPPGTRLIDSINSG